MRKVCLSTRARVLLSCVLVLCFFATSAKLRAATGYYNFQQYQGKGGGAIGGGYLQLSNDTTTVRAQFVKGNGSFTDILVMFIDTQPGGFTSTSSLSDKGDPLQTAISGFGIARSVANFAPDFGADYAIALGIDNGSALYKLVNDATGPHLELVRQGLNLQFLGNPNAPTFSFQFNWAYIGLPNANTNFFKFETSYITATGSRWLQSYEGLTGTAAFGTVTFTNYDTYGVPPVPEYTNAALAVFGGIVVTVTLGNKARRFYASYRR